MSLPRLCAIVDKHWQAALEPLLTPLLAARAAKPPLFASLHFGNKITDFEELRQKCRQPAGDDLVVLLGNGAAPQIIEYLVEGQQKILQPPSNAQTSGEAAAASASAAAVVKGGVQWCHSLWTGVDTLDPAKLNTLLTPRGIPLSNARGVYSAMLAEHVLLSILYFSRQVSRLQENKAAKRSFEDRFASRPLNGQSAVIVGFGDIGNQCARVLMAMGMKVVGCRSGSTMDEEEQGRAPQRCPDTNATVVFGDWGVETVLPTADVVIAVLPNTASTLHVFDAKKFGRMKRGATFINIGRGATVDEEALVEAIQSGQIGGAALDVFETEPLPAESPIWSLPDSKLLLTPHNADISTTMKEDSARYFCELAEQFVLEGKKPSYLVDLNKGY